MPLQYVLYTIDGPQRYNLELQQVVVVLLLLCIPTELQHWSPINSGSPKEKNDFSPTQGTLTVPTWISCLPILDDVELAG